MRFKIDENLHDDVAEALRSHGHDAQTVLDEGLRARPDPEIVEAARKEGRLWVVSEGGIRIRPGRSTEGLS